MEAHQAPPSLGFSRQEHWSGLPFPSPMHEVESEREVAQSCPTLNDPMDCSLPGSSVHGIFQTRVLEWGAIAFSKTWHSQTNKLNKYLNYDGINANRKVRMEGMHILVFGVYHSMLLDQVITLCLENKIFETCHQLRQKWNQRVSQCLAYNGNVINVRKKHTTIVKLQILVLTIY